MAAEQAVLPALAELAVDWARSGRAVMSEVVVLDTVAIPGLHRSGARHRPYFVVR